MSIVRRPEARAELDDVRGHLILAGVCPECHWRLARDGKLYCRGCQKKYRDAQRARRGRHGRPYQGLLKCGGCRRTGHDARSCPRERKGT